MMCLNRLFVLGVLAGLGTAAVASQPVQWRVDEGGNGHWYQAFEDLGCWSTHRSLAEEAGGHLATLTSAAEDAFVGSIVVVEFSNIGGIQIPDACEPGCGWIWITGEPWSYSKWASGQPEDFGGQDLLSYAIGAFEGWHDASDCPPFTGSGYVIEWSADCNNDGIVDFGQILDGSLTDADANGIPDICEQCPPDLDDNGQLNFFDIAAFVVFFQTQDPRADFNADGLFNFFDFSEYLMAFNAGCP